MTSILARGIRLALIVVIALGCLRAGRSILRLQRPAPVDTPAEAAAETTLPPPALGPVDGYWKFAAGGLTVPSSFLSVTRLDRDQLAELVETSRTETSNDGTTLIEPPPGARRVCSRWTRDDRLAMELLACDPPLPAAAVVAHWQAAGWTIESTPLDDGDDVSVMCSQGNRVVSAWSPGGHDGVETLIVVNTAIESAAGR